MTPTCPWQAIQVSMSMLNTRFNLCAQVITPLPEFGIAMVTIPEGTVSHWDFKHELTLFNAYSSSCESCLAEHKLLMRIAQQDDYQIFGLNWQDSRVAAIQWLDSHSCHQI
jgi:hypothetical protein